MISFLRECEKFCHSLAARHIPACAPFLRRYARAWRYLAAGGSAAAVDLGLLYALTEWFGLHYLLSAVVAFVVAFCVSFFLQKFWTFEDHSVERVHAQIVLYFVVAAANLGLNTLLMFLLVEKLGFWYFAAQLIAGALIACESFFISRHIVFNRNL
ncbi:MAG: GtrA family protein [Patescibacteria group bacterium]